MSQELRFHAGDLVATKYSSCGRVMAIDQVCVLVRDRESNHILHHTLQDFQRDSALIGRYMPGDAMSPMLEFLNKDIAVKYRDSNTEFHMHVSEIFGYVARQGPKELFLVDRPGLMEITIKEPEPFPL